jgi:N-succinyldiaminopimelate aminotransferase
MIGLSRATHVTVPLRAPDFQPDHDDLRAAITDRTRLIIVNSPHNPTGSVLPRETLELLVELAYEHDTLIVTDEVYEHLTFGVEHVPISSLPGGFDRTITISSGGKTFSTTGWKIGWIVAPAELVRAILAVKQFLTFVNGAPFQPAIAVGLGLPDEYFATAAATLQAKRDILSSGLSAAGFRVSHPQAGYFVIADASPLGITDAAEFCRALPSLAGVVGVPVTAFVHPDRRTGFEPLVRFAFCKKFDVLERASAQLAELRAT